MLPLRFPYPSFDLGSSQPRRESVFRKHQAVVIMTYERIKHRKRFRADHSAEVQLWTEIAKEQQEAEAGGGPP